MRIFFTILILAASLRADPPVGYYDPANGLAGSVLKAALNEIIDGHTVILYDDLFPPLKVLWENPANTSQVKLIYAGAPAAKSSFSWNREHMWPRSRGVNPGAAENGGMDDSDLFNIVPCDAEVNTTRSNLYYDESSAADGSFSDPAHAEAPLCSKDANSWEPPAAEKGDIARAMFYMAVRYDGAEPDTTDLELTTGTPSGSQMSNLSTLLSWHAADPPDAAERARNDLIFSAYQHNRNPFVDHPEYATAIWGTPGPGINAQASATIATATEAPLANGRFTVTLSSAAPADGLVVAFTMSGSAVAADFTLSGSGVSFTPATMSGMVAFAAGTTSRTATLTPVADATAEPAETAVLTLTAGAGYNVIGGATAIAISDAPPPAAGGVIASWAFDATPFPAGSIPPSTGAGTLSTANWGGTINNFSGLGGTQSLALIGDAGNNTYIEFTISSVGWTNLGFSYWTRWSSADAFDNHNWRWSTDGVNFTSIAGNFAPDDILFEQRAVNLTTITALSNAPSVKLRLHLNGANGGSGGSSYNNRIEDLVITGTRYSAAWLARFPALSGAASEKSADPDGDTLTNFTEWAFDLDPFAGSSADAVASGAVLAPDPADGNTLKLWPTITFTRRLDAPQLTYTPEQSLNLASWANGCVLVATAPGPTADSERATFRATTPLDGAGAAPRVFLRVTVSE